MFPAPAADGEHLRMVFHPDDDGEAPFVPGVCDDLMNGAHFRAGGVEDFSPGFTQGVINPGRNTVGSRSFSAISTERLTPKQKPALLATISFFTLSPPARGRVF